MKRPVRLSDFPDSVVISTRRVEGVTVIDLTSGGATVSVPRSGVAQLVGALVLAEAFPWRMAARDTRLGPSPSSSSERPPGRRERQRRDLPAAPAGRRVGEGEAR